MAYIWRALSRGWKDAITPTGARIVWALVLFVATAVVDPGKREKDVAMRGLLALPLSAAFDVVVQVLMAPGRMDRELRARVDDAEHKVREARETLTGRSEWLRLSDEFRELSKSSASVATYKHSTRLWNLGG